MNYTETDRKIAELLHHINDLTVDLEDDDAASMIHNDVLSLFEELGISAEWDYTK